MGIGLKPVCVIFVYIAFAMGKTAGKNRNTEARKPEVDTKEGEWPK